MQTPGSTTKPLVAFPPDPIYILHIYPEEVADSSCIQLPTVVPLECKYKVVVAAPKAESSVAGVVVPAPTFPFAETKLPSTPNLPTTVDDAAETNAPVKVERPVTPSVPVKVEFPVAAKVSVFRPPITVEEAVEIYPARVERPVTPSVLLKVAAPVKVLAPETVSVPPVLILVLMVDE